jgi:membrane fusion protein, multidrug efflux system
LQDDGLRSIEEGVKADDWVVVGGLQQVHPRMEVQTEESTMPSLEAPAEKTATPSTKGEPSPPAAKPATPPANPPKT